MYDAKKPMGVSTLASKTGILKETILSYHEPYLLKRGYIEISSRGRQVSDTVKRAFEKQRQNKPGNRLVKIRGKHVNNF